MLRAAEAAVQVVGGDEVVFERARVAAKVALHEHDRDPRLLAGAKEGLVLLGPRRRSSRDGMKIKPEIPSSAARRAWRRKSAGRVASSKWKRSCSTLIPSWRASAA